MSLPHSDPTPDEAAGLALALLRDALRALRGEALMTGHGERFELLSPYLLQPGEPPDALDGVALARLRSRFRELVDHALRAVEQDPARRRALRSSLRRALSESRPLP